MALRILLLTSARSFCNSTTRSLRTANPTRLAPRAASRSTSRNVRECGVAGWGWEDDGWGEPNRNGVTLRFREAGMKRLRIQVREDGVSIDQIALSAVKYRTTRPGTARNDTVILEEIR